MALPQLTPRTPQYIIQIAADDITRLRRTDVFRVLEGCTEGELRKTAHFSRVNRPDLADEVDSSLRDLAAEKAPSTD